HFKFAKFAGEREERVAFGFHVGNVVQAVAEDQQSVERNEALGIHDRTDAIGHGLVHALALGRTLHRTGQKVHAGVLGAFGFAGGRGQNLLEGIAAGVEELGCIRDLVVGLDDAIPGGVVVGLRDFALTGKNLPHADASLEGAHGVAANALILNAAEAAG